MLGKLLQGDQFGYGSALWHIVLLQELKQAFNTTVSLSQKQDLYIVTCVTTGERNSPEAAAELTRLKESFSVSVII